MLRVVGYVVSVAFSVIFTLIAVFTSALGGTAFFVTTGAAFLASHIIFTVLAVRRIEVGRHDSAIACLLAAPLVAFAILTGLAFVLDTLDVEAFRVRGN